MLFKLFTEFGVLGSSFSQRVHFREELLLLLIKQFILHGQLLLNLELCCISNDLLLSIQLSVHLKLGVHHVHFLCLDN